MSQTTPRAIAFKITAVILIAYFAFAAIVYFNDPDPIHWMLFYLTSALCCLLTVLRKDSLPLLYIVIGMAVMEIAGTGDEFLTALTANPENLGVEKSFVSLRRDFLGAFVGLLVAICLALRLQRSGRKLR